MMNMTLAYGTPILSTFFVSLCQLVASRIVLQFASSLQLWASAEWSVGYAMKFIKLCMRLYRHTCIKKYQI